MILSSFLVPVALALAPIAEACDNTNKLDVTFLSDLDGEPSVAQVYREWFYGNSTHKSLECMEMIYSSEWRASIPSHRFTERREIVQVIREAKTIVKVMSEEKLIGILETFKLRTGSIKLFAKELQAAIDAFRSSRDLQSQRYPFRSGTGVLNGRRRPFSRSHLSETMTIPKSAKSGRPEMRISSSVDLDGAALERHVLSLASPSSDIPERLGYSNITRENIPKEKDCASFSIEKVWRQYRALPLHHLANRNKADPCIYIAGPIVLEVYRLALSASRPYRDVIRELDRERRKEGMDLQGFSFKLRIERRLRGSGSLSFNKQIK